MSNKIRLSAKRSLPITAAALAGAIGLAYSAPARGATCESLGAKRVYVAGSTAVKPFLAAVAKSLVSSSTPITIVYQGQGSCTGVNYMTTSPAGAITGTGTVWNATGTEASCDLTAVTGDMVDIGVSDVYSSSCGYTLATGVKDFYGPIQSMVFAVPVTSSQTSISVEAAYMIFGFGADSAAHTVAPWTDPTALQVRSASSGTQQMIAAALAQVGSGFSAAKMKGTSNSGSGGVLTGLNTLAAASAQDKAIGILAMDVVDAESNRSMVKPLAFQFKGQSCGYTPDSSITAWDKQNVRDGHYAIWGPLHMFTSVGADGKSAKAEAQAVIDLLSGVPSADLLAIESKKGVVPDCAMRVTRTSEVGPMASYMPPKSCECAFLAAATGAAPATCKQCTTTSTDCPACNLGYCEVR
jgi:ABC-type phosphate transport system substrate-binding protein